MKFLPQAVATFASRQALKTKKHSPTLLFASGIASMTASTVLACRATLRLEDALQTAKTDLERAQLAMEKAPTAYSDKDKAHDTIIIYVRTAKTLARLYAPAILTGAAGIGALATSNKILTQRNLALTAAYAAVDEAFKSYREKVVAKYGKDEDRFFRYEAETVDVIDGDTNKVITTVRASPDNEHSMYAKFFDELNANFNRDPEINLVFLRAQQTYWNDRLIAKGHVFLNEVYESLGMPHTRAGAIVGWVAGKGTGDDYIDFGIWNGSSESVVDFVNGREGAILLDFNVDGVIYDKIDEDRSIHHGRR